MGSCLRALSRYFLGGRDSGPSGGPYLGALRRGRVSGPLEGLGCVSGPPEGSCLGGLQEVSCLGAFRGVRVSGPSEESCLGAFRSFRVSGTSEGSSQCLQKVRLFCTRAGESLARCS